MIIKRWDEIRKNTLVIAALVAGFATASVSGHGTHAPSDQDGSRDKPTVAERYAPSKPAAVVHFVKPARFIANSGETLEVHLTLMASKDIDTLTVSAKAESGLVLPKSSSLSVGALRAGTETTVTFEVTALAEGRRYVNVQAQASSPAGRHMSTYSVPVEVGDAGVAIKSRQSSNIVEDDQGNRLILMPSVKPMNDTQDR